MTGRAVAPAPPSLVSPRRGRGRASLSSRDAPWVTVLGAVLLLSGCSWSGHHQAQVNSTRTSSPVPSAPVSSRSVGLSPPVVAGLSWRALGAQVQGRPVTYLATTRRGTVALLWMNPQALTFRFIPGSQVPEGGPLLRTDRAAASWVPEIAAAFNGAFRLRDNAGGYFYRGTTVKPLRKGLASLVIDVHGRMSVQRWGRGRATTTGLEVVRQNLPMLIDDYVAATSAQDPVTRWGAANNNTRLANRSALGELSDGSLVFSYGQNVTAQDLSSALVAVHTRNAIMLDMNLWQPAGFVYWHRGGHLIGLRLLPTIHHDPAVYLAPHYKDFVVALLVERHVG